MVDQSNMIDRRQFQWPWATTRVSRSRQRWIFH